MTGTSGVVTRTLRALGARDPARERLRKMLSVTTGILLSVLWGHGVIHVLHADSGLLAMSVFLSLMSGLFVKDATAPARVVTTALLLPTLALVPILATLLQSQRLVLLAVFVLISGVAVWVRRFGSRATALGTLTFFAYFFTLFMHPDPEELPAFCLIAAGAAGTQLVMKLFLWFGRHPERELGVMLRELRVATAAALESTASPGHERALRSRLDRVDALWRAITDWQASFRTDAFTSWDDQTLALRILDACVHTEEACRQLALGPSSDGDHQVALTHALDTLDDRTPAERLAQARKWAQTVVSAFDSLDPTPPSHDDLCDYRLAECVLAHALLRDIELHRRNQHRDDAGTASDSPDTSAPEQASSSSSISAAPRAPRPATHLRRVPWRDWAPTSRLAIQAMTATTLASVVGEAISASRWYWAVLTAFLVFLSTTTRSGILTRAYRRLLGTVLGLAAGVVLTFLAHGTSGVLLAICLLCIMGMIYFAPLNYLYASFFITTMLVALYDLLGVLHGRLLLERLEETLAGCICGVICAYLLLSTTSRPALVATTDAYFDAVDGLLGTGADLAAAPAGSTSLLTAVHEVEAAQAEVDQTISAMSTAFLIIGRDRVESARSLLSYSSRSSVRFAQIVMSGAADPASSAGLARHHAVVREAVDGARQAAALARRRIDPPIDADAPGAAPPAEADASGTARPLPTTTTTTTTTTSSTTPAESLSPGIGDPTVRAALIALARFTWVMHRLDEVLAPSEDRRPTRLRHHAL